MGALQTLERLSWSLLLPLALAMLASAVGMPASNGLAAMERPEVIFKIGLFAVALSVVLVPSLVVGWGVVGAAYGFLAGNVAGSVGRWVAFEALILKRESESLSATVAGSRVSNRRVRHARSDQQVAVEVLMQLTDSIVADAWVLRPIGQGK